MQKTNYKNYTYSIDYDECAESPRQWCNLFVLHGKHRWLDKNDLSDMYIPDIKEHLQAIYGDDLHSVFVINKYEHGDISLWSGGKITSWNNLNTRPSCQFDSGICGFAVLLKSKIKEFYGKGKKPRLAKLEKILTGELKALEQWCNGEIYSYVVKNQFDEVIDSCCGYYCEEEAEREAKSTIDYYCKKDQEQEAKMQDLIKDMSLMLLLSFKPSILTTRSI